MKAATLSEVTWKKQVDYLPKGCSGEERDGAFRVSDEKNVLLDNELRGELRASVAVKNTSDKEEYVEFPLYYYKGFRLDESGEGLQIVKGENGLIRVALPSGFSGNLSISYKEPWYWKMAYTISALTLIGLIVNFLLKRGKTTKQ